MRKLASRYPILTSPLHVCDDVQRWCREHQEGNYRIISPGGLIARRPPRTVESQVHPSFQDLYRVEAPPRAIVSVAGARLVGTDGLVILPDGSFVGELVALTSDGRRSMLGRQLEYRGPLPRKVRRKEGTYYPLSVIGWENYYHWNHDVIMRASRIINYLPPETKFAAPPGSQPFHDACLELLGIDRSRIETFDGRRVWELELLFFSTPIFKTQIDTPEPLEWFRETVFDHYRIERSPERRRVYVSRRLDHHHRTVNEQEVEARLGRYGFETVIPGNLSFRDQAALFSKAEMIVGTGSGLNLNMVFAPKGAQILQFQDPTHLIYGVWTMAEALVHQYWI